MKTVTNTIHLAFALIAFALLALTPALRAAAPIPPGFSSEIIQVKFKEGTDVHPSSRPLPPDLLNSVGRITRLFTLSEQEIDRLRATGEQVSRNPLPNLNLWFQITLNPGADAAIFIENLKRLDSVETAEPAPLAAPPPATTVNTPNFTSQQGYLGPAPDGIDAIYSATIPGGNGNRIKLYDVEYNWNQTHEDLSKANGVPLLLNPGDSLVDPFPQDMANHGTAVLGEVIADNDAKGVTGISWGANVGLAPTDTAILGYNPANAIMLAVRDGSAGDVILIENQAPVCGGECGEPQVGCGPLEWIQPVFDVIQTAVANRITVVETAGNGGVNLDQPACNHLFDRTFRDSGAILVAAGGAPGSKDRQRLSYSCYGGRLDVQGWGEAIVTTGYGDLYKNPDAPADRNFWYTNTFGGTSGAGPIVAGAAINLQGIALNRFGVPLNPVQIRGVLVQTGSPQQGNTAEHIGPRPDLRAAIAIIPTPTAPHPPFFTGEIALQNGVYYLQFPNGTPFGYYSYLTNQRFIYHFDMGFEYWFDANDANHGIFFYDFASNHFFYTSPSFPFPYLYDFSLNTVLYYYPDLNRPGHYTTNPRYFYNFATGQIITM
jgi:serine protease